RILRCPHPHARIRQLNTQPAENLPGVRTVLSYQNVPEIPWRAGQTFLFDRTLRYAGEEVACVVADSEEICERALKRIEVDYELLPFVVDPDAALAPGAPPVQAEGNLFGGKPEVYARGDIDRGLAEADVTVEGELRTQTALHNSLETHGSVAAWEGPHLTVWDSTQHIYGVRDQVAQALGLPQHRVRVIKHYMGGGFGSKIEAGKYTALAALASQRSGRPVKILLDRHEENLAVGNRAASRQTIKLGAKRDGTLTGIFHRAVVGLGAYAVRIASPCGPTRRLYACDNLKTEDYGAFTNTGPYLAFRGPGYVEGTFALESMMDVLAQKLNMDPLALRLKNYAETDPITQKPYTSKGLRQAYVRGAELIDWQNRKAVKAAGSDAVKKTGFGMASQVWGGSGGPPAYALVKINPDGTAVVITGTQDIGTGSKTALAQIAAETLGVELSAVDVRLGDTQLGVYSPLSAGSMTLPSVGPAVRAAAEDARQRLLDVGAQLLEIPRERLGLEKGVFRDLETGKQTPVGEALRSLGNFMVVGRGARAPNPETMNVNTFGAQFAEVEVDTETGCVTVKRIVAVHDSGRVINPKLIHSQLLGGIIQGVGYALTEKRWVDPRIGVVTNANLDHYKLPTSEDVPQIVAEMVPLPDPQANTIGAKGVGEPPIIPTAAAIANAVADALNQRIYEIPLTPDLVLAALERQSNKGLMAT
ncbi:MAG: xanthine dehydrogenase family protein molybdopterin-binding subunit, partial [Desulfobacterales bacterium]|nr:xanthine dehydrogenase family protein molybdopterin-binding subunit [Desulfobacterales bacterium]